MLLLLFLRTTLIFELRRVEAHSLPTDAPIPSEKSPFLISRISFFGVPPDIRFDLFTLIFLLVMDLNTGPPRATRKAKQEHNLDDFVLDVQTFQKTVEDIVKGMPTPPLETGLSFPIFSGGDEDFQQFLDKFYVVANAKNYDYGTCVKVLPAYLRGKAMSVYMSIP